MKRVVLNFALATWLLLFSSVTFGASEIAKVLEAQFQLVAPALGERENTRKLTLLDSELRLGLVDSMAVGAVENQYAQYRVRVTGPAVVYPSGIGLMVTGSILVAVGIVLEIASYWALYFEAMVALWVTGAVCILVGIPLFIIGIIQNSRYRTRYYRRAPVRYYGMAQHVNEVHKYNESGSVPVYSFSF